MNYRKICLIVAFIALASAPFGVEAYQITPNPNNGSIYISTNDAVNGEDFQNNSLLQINYPDCTLTNTRTLTNYGTLMNYDKLINKNYGTLNNNGTLKNCLTNFSQGNLTNDGVINNNFGGTLTNDGTLKNNSYYSFLNNYFGATLTNNNILVNSGTLNNYGKLNNNIDIDNFSNFNNYTGAVLINNCRIDNYALLNNSGMLNNNYGGELCNLKTLKNTCTMNNNSGGTLINKYSGTLINEGVLNNNFDIGNSGLLNTTGILNNNYGGTLTNSGTLINDSGGTLTNNYGGTLTNSGTLLNVGTLQGTGTYTQVAGQTINNGSLSQTSIAIQGGSLSGTGTITGEVTIDSGASVQPGNSPGTLTINGTFSSSGNILFEIGGLGSGLYDVLNINGAANFNGGNIEFDFINDFSASAGNYWDFLSADSITGWDTLSFTLTGLGTGLSYDFETIDKGERLLITTAPVPLPSTLLLLGSGLLGLAGWRKLRKG